MVCGSQLAVLTIMFSNSMWQPTETGWINNNALYSYVAANWQN